MAKFVCGIQIHRERIPGEWLALIIRSIEWEYYCMAFQRQLNVFFLPCPISLRKTTCNIVSHTLLFCFFLSGDVGLHFHTVSAFQFALNRVRAWILLFGLVSFLWSFPAADDSSVRKQGSAPTAFRDLVPQSLIFHPLALFCLKKYTVISSARTPYNIFF